MLPPLVVQVTAVLLVPVTVAVNVRVPPVFRLAVAGVTLTATGDAVTVTTAWADRVASATLVATT